MTNHPGDYHSFLHLARMREEQLQRNSKHQDLIEQAPYRPGARAAFAGFLRTIADRLDSRAAASHTSRPRRYQRAP